MATPVCVDASVVIRQVTAPDDRVVQARWDAWDRDRTELIAPALIWPEVTNVLYRLRRHAFLSPEASDAALTAAMALPLTTIDDKTLGREAFQTALRFDLPAAYDAHYVAVAERAGARVWTADAKLKRALGERGALLVQVIYDSPAY